MEDCPSRIEIDDFDETRWLPVFKVSREHLGFFCPLHVQEIRDGSHAEKYVISTSGPDELIIQRGQ
jgi:hypothetical protein